MKRPRTDGSANLKMLLSDMVAGTLTGKGGQGIMEVEQSTQTKVQLSKRAHHYPGTSERIALCTGEISGVAQALRRILHIIKDVADSGKDAAAGSAERIIAKMVLPNSAVTSIIGPGGSGINALTARSGADMQFSDKNQSCVPNQRVLTLTGNVESVNACGAEVLEAIQVDEHLPGIMIHDAPSGSAAMLSTGSFGAGAMGGYAAGIVGSHGNLSQAFDAAPQARDAGSMPVEIAFDVSDMMAGTIVGKGGVFVQQVCQQTRANVQLSPKAQPPVGLIEGMRRVVISGSLASVHAAHTMIVSRMVEKPPPDHEGAWGKAPGSSA